MADLSAEPIRYFALPRMSGPDDDPGQQGRSAGDVRMRILEIRCYPASGLLAADGHARSVLERTVVPVPSSDVGQVIGDAVNNYVTNKISDPAFAFSDRWWVVSDPLGFDAAP
jgi:hypothetical protein